MKKKVLAIMGSPRKNRYTDKSLSVIIDNIDRDLYEVKKVDLRDLKIEHCVACEYCGKSGECVRKDSMEDLYKDFDTSDIVILAAPIYFNSVNSLTKTMIDRCQVYWSRKYVLGDSYKRGQDRKGIFLSVGGAPFTREQFTGAIPVMDYFFRAINMDYIGNMFISHTDEMKLEDEKNILKDLKYIGENIDSSRGFSIQK